MCGLAGILGPGPKQAQIEGMVASQHHRGPDAQGIFISMNGGCVLGHNRLSILDLSSAGKQPMSDPEERYWIIFNGEIYNYLELRAELGDGYLFRTKTDTEVLLAAYLKWGQDCLNRLIGMFAFAVWDEKDQSLFAARDRFGVKPFYYYQKPDGTLFLASEIKALHAAGVPACDDPVTWATYLTYGLYDHAKRTFWQGINALPAGHLMTWLSGQVNISCWYDLAERAGTDLDHRSIQVVDEEYLDLLIQSVRLRFRSDVPVGINLSGGLDSSTLLGLVQKVQGPHSDVKAFTFVTGDERYDELPWVRQMLAHTHHQSIVCDLKAADVPRLAESVQQHQDEPYGGLPTLAYARVFERAREEGVVVLLDGQGMDEQWAGYDYYHVTMNGETAAVIQGTKESPVRPECLMPDFQSLAEPFLPSKPFPDPLRNLQYRDVRYTKIPRALRFNDRISMSASTELREPFLDHRLLELAFRQPPDRKIQGSTHKWLLRRIAQKLLPQGIVEAPKRPLQTPQREWLQGPLRDWANEQIDTALSKHGGSWLNSAAVRKAWQDYLTGPADNSFFIWQWLNIGLMTTRSMVAV
jgi:asparagine synthase (glutamine-hydrolysing)